MGDPLGERLSGGDALSDRVLPFVHHVDVPLPPEEDRAHRRMMAEA
jgi:hypothetical protein